MKRVGMIVAVVAALFLAGCDYEESPRAREQQTQDQNYDKITQQQKAEAIDYSSTRDAINKWVERWGQEGQVSYVYITDSGEPTGYYVIKGLPVSYNASIVPPEKYVDLPGDGTSDLKPVQAPSMDAVYYRGGGSVAQFYAFDARTDAYYEWSVGGSQNYFLSDAPLQQYRNVPAIGDTSVEDMQND